MCFAAPCGFAQNGDFDFVLCDQFGLNFLLAGSLADGDLDLPGRVDLDRRVGTVINGFRAAFEHGAALADIQICTLIAGEVRFAAENDERGLAVFRLKDEFSVLGQFDDAEFKILHRTFADGAKLGEAFLGNIGLFEVHGSNLL